MSGPIYDPFEDSTDESPVSQYVLMILLNANRRGVERIHFERFPEVNGEDGEFTISFEKDGLCKETDTPPRDYFLSSFELWQRIIRRLKVIARTVDYGPKISVDGHINLRLSKNRLAEFYLTTNPDANSDNKVTLVNRGTKEAPINKASNKDFKEIEDEMLREMESIPEDANVLEAPILITISSSDEMWNKMDPDETRAYLEKQASGARVIINKDPKKKTIE